MTIRARVIARFPTNVEGTGGISVEKENGNWTIAPDWTALTLVSVLDDPEDKQLWAFDPVTEDYVRLSIEALVDSLPDGPPGGFKQLFDSSTTDADPGAGDFRFNNATVSSATAAYLDNADADGTTVTSIIDQYDESTSTIKGRIRFEKTTDPTIWAEFNVTGSVVDGTGYRKLTLQDGVSNGTFTAGDRFAIGFSRAGDTPTVAVGDTTTLPAGSSATVTNSGTSTDLVLDFGVPRGADASFKWSYESSTSMAAPATGGMRFNNASLASVTAIAVNAETADNGNPDQSDYIIKWDDSTSTPKAYVEIREEAGSSAVYQLTSVTDNTTWLQLAVTYVSGDINLTAGDALYFTPHIVGNKGTDGAGVGDVVGPASSVSGNLASFDDTDGKSIADSGVAAADVLVSSDIGTTVQGFDADTLKADTSDNLTVGYTATSFSAGTKSTGTYTPDPANGNLQYAVNGGAHTLAPQTSDCTILVQYTNNASAGAITTSGFTKVDGSFTTTDGHDFICTLTKINGFSHLNITRLQ